MSPVSGSPKPTGKTWGASENQKESSPTSYETWTHLKTRDHSEPRDLPHTFKTISAPKDSYHWRKDHRKRKKRKAIIKAWFWLELIADSINFWLDALIRQKGKRMLHVLSIDQHWVCMGFHICRLKWHTVKTLVTKSCLVHCTSVHIVPYEAYWNRCGSCSKVFNHAWKIILITGGKLMY